MCVEKIYCLSMNSLHLERSDLLINSIQVIPTEMLEFGGYCVSVASLSRSLENLGHHTRLVAPEPMPSWLSDDFMQYFPVMPFLRNLMVSPSMKIWLKKQVLAGEVNIIHSHSLWRMPSIYAGAAVKNAVCSHVVSPEGTLSKEAMSHSKLNKSIFWNLLQKKCLLNASAFHATSEQEYLDIRRHGFRQPIAIISNGVEIVEKIPKVESDVKTLLFLGRIHPIKGVDILLNAWQRIQNQFKDWEIQIAGPDDGYLAEMELLSVQLGLERCKFLGPLYGEEKQKAYTQAALYVLPTLSENFGLTIAESLAAGTPVITTKGAPWQGLETHKAGWWVDTGIDPLVLGLQDAMSRPNGELSIMGSNGSKWMKQDFSWDVIGSNMIAFYRWLLTGKDKPSFVVLD